MASAFLPGFGPLLKQFRRASHLTQAQLAERAGFSVTYISKLERGARQPQRSTVVLLADALSLSGDERATFESSAESSAQAPGVARHRRDRDDSGDDTGSPPLPVGGFLGALPAGPLVGRARELAAVDEALAAVATG